MSKYLNDENMHIITNIMSGIQTYGQQYSDERDWGNFTEAYAATANEVSITIGWASNYGEQARRLLQLIQTDYPDDFKNNDTAGIAQDIKNPFTKKPYYQPTKNSAKAKSIIAIISSLGGKKSQDKLFSELIDTYISHAIDYGINKDNIKALMMWCQIEHLGGSAPVKRIFGRCGLNPSMDAIISALKKDQQNGNSAEVGDKMFQSRHDCCYKWINQYVKDINNTNNISTTNSYIDFSKYYGKISNSGSDQNGSYSYGSAGDQTKREWEIRTWYNRPWNCVLRHPDQNVRELIAELSIQAANNDYIGYDQNQRETYWQCLKNCNYRPSQIRTYCESDCSAGVIANTRAVGYILNISALKNINATYTGNMRSGYKAAGFEVLTASKYLNGYDYLVPGDILLNDAAHTATNLGIGKNVEYNFLTTSTKEEQKIQNTEKVFDKNLAGKYTVNASDGLNLRIAPNKDIIVNIPNKKTVTSEGYYINSDSGKWLFVKYKKQEGFVFLKYLKKKIDSTKEEQSTPQNSNLSFQKKADGIVTIDSLNIRKWAGSQYDLLSSIPVIYKDQKVEICDIVTDQKGKNWYFIKINGIYGFSLSTYIKNLSL